MDNYTTREDLKTTVTKALEHNVRTSDGMNWNLHDLVYEALSEEWGRRDGEISDLWADDGPSGYQPPSYEPVNPERRTPPNTLRWPDLTSKKKGAVRPF